MCHNHKRSHHRILIKLTFEDRNKKKKSSSRKLM